MRWVDNSSHRKSSSRNCTSRRPKHLNVEALSKGPLVRLFDHGEQLLRSKTSGPRQVLSGLPNLAPFRRGDHPDRILLGRHLRRLFPQHPPLYHERQRYLPLWQWNKIRQRFVSNENDPLRSQGKPLYPPRHKSQVPLFRQ